MRLHAAAMLPGCALLGCAAQANPENNEQGMTVKWRLSDSCGGGRTRDIPAAGAKHRDRLLSAARM